MEREARLEREWGRAAIKSADVAWRRLGAAAFAVEALVAAVLVALVLVVWREEAWARVAGVDFCAMRAGRELRAVRCEVRTGAMRVAAGRDSGRVG